MGIDLRKYARQTNTRLIVGGVLLLFLVGDGLIYFIYGPGAAVLGLLCLASGFVPILLILVFFWVLDLIVKNADKN